MKDMMKHKGYYGSVHYDSAELIFYGKLEFIKALVSYEAEDAKGIKKVFEDAVDDYLATCEAEGIAAEKPFKGSFNVRTGHKLHEMVALTAQREKMSINKFICYILQKECQKKLKLVIA